MHQFEDTTLNRFWNLLEEILGLFLGVERFLVRQSRLSGDLASPLGPLEQLPAGEVLPSCRTGGESFPRRSPKSLLIGKEDFLGLPNLPTLGCGALRAVLDGGGLLEQWKRFLVEERHRTNTEEKNDKFALCLYEIFIDIPHIPLPPFAIPFSPIRCTAETITATGAK